MKNVPTTYLHKAISVKKVNEVLVIWVNHNLNSSHPHIVDIYKSLLINECCIVSKDFSRFIRNFASIKGKENYQEVCDKLVKQRKEFIHQLIYILDRNRSNPYIFCYISLAWSEVFEYFLEHALQNFDFFATHIALQLQDDLNHIVDRLFEKKKDPANIPVLNSYTELVLI
jgi:hypothetical protein